MCESSSSTILILSNSDTSDSSTFLEELLNSPLFSSETEVSDEDGVGLSILSLWLISSSSLSREFNPYGSSIKVFLISVVQCSSSTLVISKFNECFSLGDSTSCKKFALLEFTIGTEELSKTVLIGIEGETLNEEFELSIVFVTDCFFISGNFLSLGWGFVVGIGLLGIGVRVAGGCGSSLLGWCSLLDWSGIR